MGASAIADDCAFAPLIMQTMMINANVKMFFMIITIWYIVIYLNGFTVDSYCKEKENVLKMQVFF